MAAHQVEMRRSANEADEQLSLDIYNTVWPQRAVTMAEARSFTSSVRDYADFLAGVDGAAAGSALIAILPQRRRGLRDRHRATREA